MARFAFSADVGCGGCGRRGVRRGSRRLPQPVRPLGAALQRMTPCPKIPSGPGWAERLNAAFDR